VFFCQARKLQGLRKVFFATYSEETTMQKKFLRALLVATAITSVSPLYASVSDDFLNQPNFMGQATAQAITSTQDTLQAYKTDTTDDASAPVFPHTGAGSDVDPFVVTFPLPSGFILTGDPSDSQTIVGAVNYIFMEHALLGENNTTVNAQRQAAEDALAEAQDATHAGSLAHQLAEAEAQRLAAVQALADAQDDTNAGSLAHQLAEAEAQRQAAVQALADAQDDTNAGSLAHQLAEAEAQRQAAADALAEARDATHAGSLAHQLAEAEAQRQAAADALADERNVAINGSLAHRLAAAEALITLAPNTAAVSQAQALQATAEAQRDVARQNLAAAEDDTIDTSLAGITRLALAAQAQAEAERDVAIQANENLERERLGFQREILALEARLAALSSNASTGGSTPSLPSASSSLMNSTPSVATPVIRTSLEQEIFELDNGLQSRANIRKLAELRSRLPNAESTPTSSPTPLSVISAPIVSTGPSLSTSNVTPSVTTPVVSPSVISVSSPVSGATSSPLRISLEEELAVLNGPTTLKTRAVLQRIAAIQRQLGTL
jgi:hypothetical protein